MYKHAPRLVTEYLKHEHLEPDHLVQFFRGLRSLFIPIVLRARAGAWVGVVIVGRFRMAAILFFCYTDQTGGG